MKIVQFARIYEQWTITRIFLFWYSVFIHSLSFFSLSPFLLFTHINANANAKDFDEWIYSLMLVVYIHTSFGHPLPVPSSSHLFSPSPLFSLYDYVCIASHVYVPSHTYNPYRHNNIFNVFFNLKISIFLPSFFLPPFFFTKIMRRTR